MKHNEVIVHVAGEGGSIALYGLRTETGWLFSREFIHSAAAFQDESPTEAKRKVVDSWPDALALLEQNPWYMLSPVLVHPEFQTDILKAVMIHDKSTEGNQIQYRQKWEKLCTPPADGSTIEELSRYQVKENVHSSDGWLYDDAEDDRPKTEEEIEYLREVISELGLSEEDATIFLGEKDGTSI